MKKSLIILALTLLQCACATPGAGQYTPTPLLSFDAISAEITVGYETLEAAIDPSQTVVMNREK